MIRIAGFTFGQATVPGETIEDKNVRMQWWRDARFGMFIHWGASSLLGGEWNGKAYGDACFLPQNAKMPIHEYAEALSAFNPVDFNAEEWVQLAQAAGMKYIVFIAKHHDGFAMWKSDASAFNIADHTVFGRDVLTELADACKKYEMPLGLYYSQARDWFHPGGAIGLRNMPTWDDAQKGDFAQYIRNVAVPQVRELLTRYGTVSVLWWDTPDQMTPELAEELSALLPLQPGIITNSRLLNRDGTGGDFDTPERYIPRFRDPPDRDMEVCDTIGFRWVYTFTDKDWKSPKELIHKLIEISSKGGNFLLNVGPNERGVIPEPQREPLLGVGAWLEQHGEAIYGTQQGPFRYWEAGRATAKGQKIYLHVLDWPSDGQLSVPLSNTPLAVYPLTNSAQSLAVQFSEQGVMVDVSSISPDPIASVLVMELGEPPVPIRQGHAPDPETGAYRLTAVDGERYGLQLRLVGDVIPRWANGNYYVSWPIYVETPGRYAVQMTYSCAPNLSGGTCKIDFDGQAVVFQTQSTASLQDFQTFDAGQVTFSEAGSVEVELRLPQRPDPSAIQIREIILIPASEPPPSPGDPSGTISVVPIGSAGNAAHSSGYGSVGYEYSIGKYEITAKEWANAVKADPRIAVGSEGAPFNTGTKPAVKVAWIGAAMFCNWLTSGDAYTGAYLFNASGVLTRIDRAAALAAYRTVYVLPTEDEWVKAAYWTGSGYSRYPNGTNVAPEAGTQANVNNVLAAAWAVGSGLKEQNGTYDMLGNAGEWTENSFGGPDSLTASRVMRDAGAYRFGARDIDYRDAALSERAIDFAHHYYGFRIAALNAPAKGKMVINF